MNHYALVYYLKNHIDDINFLRKKYDPMVTIINPHMTIIFPILEKDIGEKKLVNHIQEKINVYKKFSVIFGGLQRSWDDYLFLITQTGTRELQALHDELYTGVLVPFLRNDITFIPHITLGVFQGKEKVYAVAIDEAKQKNFSFEEEIDRLSLIKGDGKITPQIVQEYSLS